MTSIYRRALGEEFDRLHSELQRRFNNCSADNIASIGRGVMDWVRLGPWYTWPFLRLGALRKTMFAAAGENVPFTVENYAQVDGFGRETLTWIRTFELDPPRRFDERMVYSDKRGCIVVYAGTHQHLAVELSLAVDCDGGLRMRTGAQHVHEGPIALRFPLMFSGSGDIRVWYEDRNERCGIDVNVSNPVWGPVFQYRGWFQSEWTQCTPSQLPPHVRPVREERRD